MLIATDQIELYVGTRHTECVYKCHYSWLSYYTYCAINGKYRWILFDSTSRRPFISEYGTTRWAIVCINFIVDDIVRGSQTKKKQIKICSWLWAKVKMKKNEHRFKVFTLQTRPHECRTLLKNFWPVNGPTRHFNSIL